MYKRVFRCTDDTCMFLRFNLNEHIDNRNIYYLKHTRLFVCGQVFGWKAKQLCSETVTKRIYYSDFEKRIKRLTATTGMFQHNKFSPFRQSHFLAGARRFSFLTLHTKFNLHSLRDPLVQNLIAFVLKSHEISLLWFYRSAANTVIQQWDANISENKWQK